MDSNKHILVTGGNSGIGFALCKLLLKDHDCFVYLGSRSIKKGQEALEAIKYEVPEKSDKIELIQIDVMDNDTCLKAAENLKSKGMKTSCRNFLHLIYLHI